MVGPPKTLQDLRKVDGAIRITCRACKRVSLLDREETIMMGKIGASHDWSTFCREASCPDCSGHDVKVQIEAFGQGLPELRKRRAEMIMIELALTILQAASYSGSAHTVSTEAVRLALRVIHPRLRDRKALEMFWEAYVNNERRPWESPAGATREIVRGLLKRGYGVPAELRMGEFVKRGGRT